MLRDGMLGGVEAVRPEEPPPVKTAASGLPCSPPRTPALCWALRSPIDVFNSNKSLCRTLCCTKHFSHGLLKMLRQNYMSRCDG